MFEIDASSIDRSLPVPVGRQLYGLLSYCLAFGEVAHGAQLLVDLADRHLRRKALAAESA